MLYPATTLLLLLYVNFRVLRILLREFHSIEFLPGLILYCIRLFFSMSLALSALSSALQVEVKTRQDKLRKDTGTRMLEGYNCRECPFDLIAQIFSIHEVPFT